MATEVRLLECVPASPSDLKAAITGSSSLERADLEAQAKSLRSQLKEWEKAFAAENAGRKPSKDEIKRDTSGIGKAYKDYSRVKDILDGKTEAPARKSQKTQDSTGRSAHSRKDSLKRRKDTGGDRPRTVHSEQFEFASPRKHSHPITSTPRKQVTSPLPFNAIPSSTTPRPLREFIGPTPQRDGKVLGLFDLLSGSSKATPTTGRKRRADVLADAPVNILQTPSRKKNSDGGRPDDILDFLDADAPDTGRRQRFERTPASEGKKFLLSQFFATPTTARFTGEENIEQGGVTDSTPLRTKLFAGREAPKMDVTESLGLDSTPPFLRRTTSIAMSRPVTSSGGNANTDELGFASPQKVRMGPSRLSLFKQGRSLSEIVKDLRQAQDEEHDDDLEALNEMEAGDEDIQVEDSQVAATQEGGEPRIWKKKGQKRTTKRINMKPPTIKSKPKQAEPDEPVEDQVITVQDTQLANASTNILPDDFDSDYEDLISIPDDILDTNKDKTMGKPPKKAGTEAAEKGKSGRKFKANTVSSMNFRSLKIKNKNSKGKKGGRGRYR